VNTVEQAVEDWFRHHRHASAETPAAAVTIEPTPGGPVSLLDEIKTDIHAIAAKFEAVDVAAAAKMEAIAVNPGAMALVDAALGYLHLPPQAFNTAIAALGEVSKLFAPPQPQPEQQPSFTPSGPQVGGQA
jgi:hypothetical protein